MIICGEAMNCPFAAGECQDLADHVDLVFGAWRRKHKSASQSGTTQSDTAAETSS